MTIKALIFSMGFFIWWCFPAQSTERVQGKTSPAYKYMVNGFSGDLTIVNISRSRAQVKIHTVTDSAQASTCELEFEATPENNGSISWTDPEKNLPFEKEPPCRIKITLVNKKAEISTSDSPNCSTLCGVGADFSGSYSQ
jgi:hypothetical protein